MAFSNHDVVIDSPINNFAVLNPLNNKMNTYSEGNLTAYSEKDGCKGKTDTFRIIK